MTERLSFHPIADAFPLMDGAEFEALVKDIRAHGQREPIILFEGKILDGRNRYRACDAAGADAWLESFCDKDPIAFVISKNIARRHLDPGQRAMAAAKLADQRAGRAKPAEMPAANLQRSREEVAEVAKDLKVSERSVWDANVVLDKGIPELQRLVEQGKASVSGAAELARKPETEQRAIVSGLSPRKAVTTLAKAAKADRKAAKPRVVVSNDQPAHLSAFMDAWNRHCRALWNRLSPEDRETFRATLDPAVFDRTKAGAA